jgi:hypothetical protein
MLPSLQNYGMVIKTNPSEQDNIWSCPERNFQPRVEAGNPTVLAIAYQYFGGITSWVNPAGTIANPPSPVNLAYSKPGWCIAAEANARFISVVPDFPAGDTGRGADGYVAGESVRVPHPSSIGKHPEGGKILFADGSARWI